MTTSKMGRITCIGMLALASTFLPIGLEGPELKGHPHEHRTQRFNLGGSAVEAIAPVIAYRQHDFSDLKGISGFSDNALEIHFKLYGGYVKNTNIVMDDLAELAKTGQSRTPHYAELKRRLGWEFNGMRLHEYYFQNLGGNGELDTASMLARLIDRDFGGFEQWASDFRATGSMRGIGWVVLYQDPASGRLINTWINEHDVGHLSGATPLLIMDVFEHAYMVDYELNRGQYIDAFMKNIDWDTVTARIRAG